MFLKLYVLELLRCGQLRFVTLRHVTFTLCCFTLCSNLIICYHSLHLCCVNRLNILTSLFLFNTEWKLHSSSLPRFFYFVRLLVSSVLCDCIFSPLQRGGMGLLEYSAMPSLRDVAHAGLLCTFTPAARAPQQLLRYGKDRRYDQATT